MNKLASLKALTTYRIELQITCVPKLWVGYIGTIASQTIIYIPKGVGIRNVLFAETSC